MVVPILSWGKCLRFVIQANTGSDQSIPDWKDVCRQIANTVGCAMALHMVLHVETYDERANSELMKYLQRELGLSARELPANLQSKLTAAQACSVRKMPENLACGPTNSPNSSFRSAPNIKDAKPRIMLKPTGATSILRECRPVTAFPRISHAVNRAGTPHRQRGRGHNQFSIIKTSDNHQSLQCMYATTSGNQCSFPSTRKPEPQSSTQLRK